MKHVGLQLVEQVDSLQSLFNAWSLITGNNPGIEYMEFERIVVKHLIIYVRHILMLKGAADAQAELDMGISILKKLKVSDDALAQISDVTNLLLQ